MTNQKHNNCEAANIDSDIRNSSVRSLPTETHQIFRTTTTTTQETTSQTMATAHLPIQKKKYYEHNGEPGCQGLEEVNRMFRNFWDPTAYWVCDKQGTRARLQRCPQSQLYSEELGRCIHYSEWSWTDPKEPPSRPKC